MIGWWTLVWKRNTKDLRNLVFEVSTSRTFLAWFSFLGGLISFSPFSGRVLFVFVWNWSMFEKLF